jgi:hypothetical protein
MTKLKLTSIHDDKPVRLTVSLPATLHRDLVAYAEILARIRQDRRTGEIDRAHVGEIHRKRSGVRQRAPRARKNFLKSKRRHPIKKHWSR